MFYTYFRTKNDKTKIHGIYTDKAYFAYYANVFSFSNIVVFCIDTKMLIVLNI